MKKIYVVMCGVFLSLCFMLIDVKTINAIVAGLDGLICNNSEQISYRIDGPDSLFIDISFTDERIIEIIYDNFA